MKSFLEYLTEDNLTTSNTTNNKNATKKAVEIVAKAMAAIREKYIKCLAVLTLFDNQSGNIAEMIMVLLLNKYNAAINGNFIATLEGGSLDLTDITVKVGNEIVSISLKNSKLNNTIKLGTDTKSTSDTRITKDDMKKVDVVLRSLYQNTEKLGWAANIPNTYKKLQDFIKNKKEYDELKTHVGKVDNFPEFKDIEEATAIIGRRIGAVIIKLCGKDDNNLEVFCVCEKNEKTLSSNSSKINYIAGLIINMFSFNRNTLNKKFSNLPINLTTLKKDSKIGSWSIGNYIEADNTMMLNISHQFINDHQDENIMNKVDTKIINDKYLENEENIEVLLKKFKQKLNTKQVLQLKGNFVDQLEKMFDELTTENS